MRRVKAGRDLRSFQSAVIPPELRLYIEGALEGAESVEDVFQLFGEVLEELDRRPLAA